MILNEYRLNPANRQDQEILVKHLEISSSARAPCFHRDTSPRAARHISGFYARSKVLLISTYELGRQPFGLASPGRGYALTASKLLRWTSRDSRWTKRRYAPPG